MKNIQFVLASASTARLGLLRKAGIEPLVCASDYDESLVLSDNPGLLAQTLALRKAQTVSDKFPSSLVMGCDSILFVKGKIYGKPKDSQEACDRWLEMQGDTGELYTGHALIDNIKNCHLVKSQVTKVYFAPMTLDTIRAYVATGEPLKCAGSFALEGRGGLFIDKIEGCHSNVIGLSLPLLRQMLAELGYQVTDFWQD
ncbi:MAG: nucleoside triphosphate pyrophosphatase [Cyanobacteria bacterium P01_A01_bin.45]